MAAVEASQILSYVCEKGVAVGVAVAAAVPLTDCQQALVVVAVVVEGQGGSWTPVCHSLLLGGASAHCLKLMCWLEAEALRGLSENMMDKNEKHRH